MSEWTATGLWGVHSAFLSVIVSYQAVDPTQCVVGIVEGVGQLVHPIIGFTVTIETHSYGGAVEGKENEKNRDFVFSSTRTFNPRCFVAASIKLCLHPTQESRRKECLTSAKMLYTFSLTKPPFSKHPL